MKLQYDILIWHRLRLDGYPTRLCTSVAEDKNIPSSGKTLANTEEEQLSYNRKAPFKLVYINDSSTDSSDCSDYSDIDEQIKAELRDRAMAEEAETQVDILAEYKEGEELYCYNPSIKYKPLKRYDVPRFAFSDDSSTDWSNSESDTQNETMVEEVSPTQKDLAGTRGKLLSYCNSAKSLTSSDLQSVAEDLAVPPPVDLQYKPDVQIDVLAK